MGAESDEPCAAAGLLLPRVELAANKADRFPQRPSGAGDASTLELNERCRHLDDAGIEIDRGAGGQLIRRADAMQQIAADERARRPEHPFRPLGHIIYIERELGLQAHSSQPQSRLRMLAFLHLLVAGPHPRDLYLAAFRLLGGNCGNMLLSAAHGSSPGASAGIDVTYPRSRCT